MRIAMLLKYGGAYLDLDVISLKPVIGPGSMLPPNSVGIQADENCGDAELTNGAVMVFEKGARFLRMMQSSFRKSYNGSQWGQNGPRLLTRVWREAVEDKSLFRGATKDKSVFQGGRRRAEGKGEGGEVEAEEGTRRRAEEDEREGVEGWKSYRLTKTGESCRVPYTSALHVQPAGAFYSIPWRHACEFCAETEEYQFSSSSSAKFKSLTEDR
jgi:hypothetical protein